METKSLYQISGDMLALFDQIETAEGDLSPEVEASLAITQDELTGKACGYGYILLEKKAFVGNIDNEIKRLEALKKPVVNAIKNMENRLTGAMDMFEIKKIEGESIRLSIRESKRLICTNEDMDISALPTVFQKTKTTVSVDTAEIKRSIAGGEEVDGYEIQTFSNLQIK